jgi:hypothetical protein
MERSPLYVKQSVDIWSLGCVFSEVAVWVVHGKDRLEEYRQMRQDETRQLHEFKDIGCFHDSQRVLQTVGSMHQEVFDNVRQSDHVTKSVVKSMIMDMLDKADGRPDTKELWRKSRKILSNAENKLKGMVQEPEPFLRGEQSGGRVKPALLPDTVSSNYERTFANDALWPGPADAKYKRGQMYRVSDSREDTSSPESTADDPFGTPNRMSYIASSPPTSPLDAQASNYGQHRRDTSAGYNHHVASPEQLSETDESGLNNSPVSRGKARRLGHSMHVNRVTGQLQAQNLHESMSGLTIGSYLELTPKEVRATVSRSPHAESDSPKPPTIVNSSATATPAPKPDENRAPHRVLQHLSLAEASEWILKKKRGQNPELLENKVYLNELQQRDHVCYIPG